MNSGALNASRLSAQEYEMGVIDLVTLDHEKVRRLAVGLGWVRADLARASGLSSNPITTLFSGGAISPRTAKKIADALGVTIADLITETPQD